MVVIFKFKDDINEKDVNLSMSSRQINILLKSSLITYEGATYKQSDVRTVVETSAMEELAQITSVIIYLTKVK